MLVLHLPLLDLLLLLSLPLLRLADLPLQHHLLADLPLRIRGDNWAVRGLHKQLQDLPQRHQCLSDLQHQYLFFEQHLLVRD